MSGVTSLSHGDYRSQCHEAESAQKMEKGRKHMVGGVVPSKASASLAFDLSINHGGHAEASPTCTPEVVLLSCSHFNLTT